MVQETRKLMCTAMGFTSSAVTPESTVGTFSGGERQGVAITRALYFEAELIILDEPTMGLSISETKKCLDFVNGIKQAGKSAIFIDHNIVHVYPVADRIVVLDRGTIAGQFMKGELTFDELIDRLTRLAQTGQLGNQHPHGLIGRHSHMASANPIERPLSPTDGKGIWARLLRKYALQIAIVFVALVIWAFFFWRSPRTFGAYDIYNSLMSTTPFFALMAIPLTLVVIAKEIDLSFGSVMAWGMAAFDCGVTRAQQDESPIGRLPGFSRLPPGRFVRRMVERLYRRQTRDPLAGRDHRNAVLLAGRGDGGDERSGTWHDGGQRHHPVPCSGRPDRSA